ncbi:FUT-1 [Mytilus coruscus]|uniref:Fucosyltransferase n=1 Tax=Mytilus coruscus TaxID=42192 RepID=A0A6J8DRU1_MYTCO|nr:FUT-1 [Mytilus coruscus]
MYIFTVIGFLSIGYYLNNISGIGTKFKFLAQITLSNKKTTYRHKLLYTSSNAANKKEFTNIFSLFWYTKPTWIPANMYNYKFRNCAFKYCKILNDIAYLNISDAVLFHHSEMNSVDIPKKAKHQTWLFMSDESNVHTMKYFMDKKWRNEFDWTYSYRSDSDIYLPYGEFARRSLPAVKNYSSIYRKKKKNIAWVVSDCKSRYSRNKYVTELKKYIDVDVYGKCGKPCSDWNDDACFKHLSGDYKFYLSFENSLCEDYVTEKAFRLYQEDFDIIPVYRGAPNVKDILPTGTFISTQDFKSPKELAVYLKYVADNESVYHNYLKAKDKFWASPYTRHEIVEFIYCSVCEKLSTNYTRGTKLNLTRWITDKGCHKASDI